MKFSSFYLPVFLAGLILFSCSWAKAQENDSLVKVAGVVNDAFGPLSGAIISLEPNSLTAISNIDGFFSFEVTSGDYKLFIEDVNFGKYSQDITIGENDTFITVSLIQETPTIGGRADPVEIISAKDIDKSPYTRLTQVLQYLVPGFHSTPQTIADGTDHIDPISYRGLGPDQVLILVNGKRWHSSSLVNVNGTFGRGSASVDLNVI